MELPGLIRIQPNQTDLLRKAAKNDGHKLHGRDVVYYLA